MSGEVALPGDLAGKSQALREEIERMIAENGLGNDQFASVMRALGSVSGLLADTAGAIQGQGRQMPSYLPPAAQKELLRAGRREIASGARTAVADAIRWVQPASLIAAGCAVVTLAAGLFFLGCWSVDPTPWRAPG